MENRHYEATVEHKNENLETWKTVSLYTRELTGTDSNTCCVVTSLIKQCRDNIALSDFM